MEHGGMHAAVRGALAVFAAVAVLCASGVAGEIGPVDLRGTVVLENDGETEAFLLKERDGTLPIAEASAAGLLRPHVGKEVEIRCFLNDEGGTAAIVRVVKVLRADPETVRLSPFRHPCEGYRAGLKGRGNFGVRVSRGAKGPFANTFHLAEDVWLPGGTPVISVADGIVAYSDFSPTWTEEDGTKHWNLGNVIVIEHALSPAEKDLAEVCSVYVHLSAKRLVQRGDRVRRGQKIGEIGKDRSEENGFYPEHLHFGLHKGPYAQLSPARRSQLIRQARESGLPRVEGGKVVLVKGTVAAIEVVNRTTLDVVYEDGQRFTGLPLLVSSTFPGTKPAPIMDWCSGYGDKEDVKDWLCPSRWIETHLSRLDR